MVAAGAARDTLLVAAAMLARGEVEAANQALLILMQESLLPLPLPVCLCLRCLGGAGA